MATATRELRQPCESVRLTESFGRLGCAMPPGLCKCPYGVHRPARRQDPALGRTLTTGGLAEAGWIKVRAAWFDLLCAVVAVELVGKWSIERYSPGVWIGRDPKDHGAIPRVAHGTPVSGPIYQVPLDDARITRV